MSSQLKKHKVRTTYMFRSDPINQVCIYSEPPNGSKKSNDSTSLVGQMYALCPADYQYSNKLASVAAYQNVKSNQIDQSDIECDYCPPYEISFGETVCSFGLPYNDHNYAVPNGLTPPNTPPHLKDGFNNASFFVFDNDDFQPRTDDYQDPNVPALSEKTSQLVNYADFEDGVSRWEKKLRAILKAQNLINGEPNEEPITNIPVDAEFGKVVEVPEELCVSPSHFNDIDSDTDDFMFDDSCAKISKRTGTLHTISNPGESTKNSNTASYSSVKYIQTADVMSRAQAANCSKISRKLPDNANVNCFCSKKHNDGGMVQCILCFNWQHFDCIYYGEKLSQPYTCHICLPRPFDINRANQIQNLKVSGKPIPFKLYYSQPPQPKVVIDPSAVFSPKKATTVSIGKNITDKIIESHSNLVKAIPSPPRSSKRKQDFSCQSYMEVDNYKNLTKTPNSDTKEKRKDSRSKKQPGRPGRPSKASTKASLESSAPPTNSSNRTAATSEIPSDSPIKVEMTSPDEIPVVSTSRIGQRSLLCDDDNLPACQAAPASARMTTTVASAEQGSEKAIIRYGIRKKRRRKLPSGLSDPVTLPTENTNPTQSIHYEQILENQCSDLLQKQLNEACASGKVFYYDAIPPFLMRSPLCRIVLFGPSERGLESSCSLTKGDYIAEFLGCVMLLSEYESFSDIYHEYNRFLLSVNFDNKDIIVDASKVGNDTRFIRRSCKPNCCVHTLLVGSSIHFMIRSSEMIVPGTELTLPFDVNYTMCRYNVECACSRSRCPVTRWNKKVESRRAVPTLDYSKYIQSQLRVLSRPMSQNQPYKPTNSLPNSSRSSKNDLHQYVVTNFTLDDYKEPPLNSKETFNSDNEVNTNEQMPFRPIIRTRRQKRKS